MSKRPKGLKYNLHKENPTSFKKGFTPWNKGLKRFSEKAGFQKGNTLAKFNKGKKLSNEHKQKLSMAKINNPRTKEFYRGIGLKGAMNLCKRKTTSIEKIVYQYLLSQGVVFETQKLINGRFLVDAYIPERNMIIEIDGNYWHSLDRVVKKDKAENAYLTKCGYKLLRLSEQEINSGNFERMVN